MKSKRYLFSFLLVIVTFLFSATAFAKKSNDKAVLAFDKTKIEVGEVKLNSVTPIEFTFKNKGKKNLVIMNALSGCPCISVEYPKEPIAKGKKGKIIVKFDSTNMRLGAMQKNVSVMSNSTEGTQQLVFNITIVQ